MDLNYNLFEPPSRAPPPAPPGADPDGLRYYQREGLVAVQALLDGGSTSMLVVWATGLGKTQLAGAVIKNWEKGAILFLAHRDELIAQAQSRIEQMTGLPVEVEQGELRSSSRAQVVVGSVQSFNQKRLDRLGRKRFSLIIIDEAHHYIAVSYRKVLEFFEAPRLGITATPDRGDEKAMGQVFDEVAHVMDIENGIAAGYLVPILGRQVQLQEIKLDGIGKSAGDLAAGALDEEMLKSVEGIVTKTLELEPDRKGVAFFPGVRSAELAMQKFNAVRPGSACFISGETDPDERKVIVSDFKKGRYQYLCNCQIATEGFDAPDVNLIIQGRPTLSRAFYAQTVGRGTRVLPGVVDGIYGEDGAEARRAAIAASAKPDMMILDFVGNSTKHALISLEDLLGGNFTPAEIEEAKKKKRGAGDEAYDAQKALAAARKELERIARASKASVTAAVRDFDPFKVYGMAISDEQRYSSRFGLKPASEAQRAALLKRGVPDEDLTGLSKIAAGKLLDRMGKRQARGLATYKQMRTLQKWGVNAQDIEFRAASDAIDYIASTGWGRKPINPKHLNHLLFQTKEPGE